jgi:IclR family acetate operon transcriptional repressor
VFLAHGGTPPAGPLKAFTERTIVDHDVLRAEVARVRERGWGQAVGEREKDLNAIAVPVLDPAGKLVAILGAQGPAVRFSPRVCGVPWSC